MLIVLQGMAILRSLLQQTNSSALFQMLILQKTFIFVYDNYFNKSLTVVHGNREQVFLNAILTSGLPLKVNSVEAAEKTTNLLIFDDVIWQNDLRPTGRILVLTSNNTTQHSENWFSTLWKISRLSDAIIMAVTNDAISFNTFFPYRELNKCGTKINIVQLPIHNLYPIKFEGNLHKCEIRYITEWLMPYVRKPGEKNLGIEDMIFNSIISKLNGSAKEISLPDGETAQNAYNENGELIGGLKKAKMQEVDVIFSGFTYRLQHYDIVDMLTPHTIDRLVWYVPSAQPLPGLNYLYMAFTMEVWMAVGIVIISTATAGFISKSSTLLTDITAITLNLQVSKNVSKMFYIFCYFYSLHITTFYQASLFTLFSRTIFEKPLQTIEEAADANLVTYLFNYHKPLFNLSDHSLWNKLLAKTDFKNRHNPATFVYNRNFVVLLQNNPVHYYIETIPIYDEYGPALVQIPLEFLMYPVMFYMSKGNVLKPSVEFIIQKLVEGGFVHKWQKTFDPNVLAKRKGLGSSNVKLSMFHLSGAFGCLIVGLLITPIVFCMEILTKKVYLKKKIKMSKKIRRHIVI